MDSNSKTNSSKASSPKGNVACKEKKILQGRRQQRHSTEIGSEYHRWWVVRSALGFETNEHIAGLLLDGFHGLLQQLVVMCGGETYQPGVHGDVKSTSETNDGAEDLSNPPSSSASASPPGGIENIEEFMEFKNAVGHYCDSLWKICCQQGSQLQQLDKTSQPVQEFLIRLMGYLRAAKGKSFCINSKKKQPKPNNVRAKESPVSQTSLAKISVPAPLAHHDSQPCSTSPTLSQKTKGSRCDLQGWKEQASNIEFSKEIPFQAIFPVGQSTSKGLVSFKSTMSSACSQKVLNLSSHLQAHHLGQTLAQNVNNSHSQSDTQTQKHHNLSPFETDVNELQQQSFAGSDSFSPPVANCHKNYNLVIDIEEKVNHASHKKRVLSQESYHPPKDKQQLNNTDDVRTVGCHENTSYCWSQMEKGLIFPRTQTFSPSTDARVCVDVSNTTGVEDKSDGQFGFLLRQPLKMLSCIDEETTDSFQVQQHSSESSMKVDMPTNLSESKNVSDKQPGSSKTNICMVLPARQLSSSCQSLLPNMQHITQQKAKVTQTVATNTSFYNEIKVSLNNPRPVGEVKSHNAASNTPQLSIQQTALTEVERTSLLTSQLNLMSAVDKTPLLAIQPTVFSGVEEPSLESVPSTILSDVNNACLLQPIQPAVIPAIDKPSLQPMQQVVISKIDKPSLQPIQPAIFSCIEKSSPMPATLGTPVILYPSSDNSLTSLSSLVHNIVYSSYGTILKPLSLTSLAHSTPQDTPSQLMAPLSTTVSENSSLRRPISAALPVLSSQLSTGKTTLVPFYISHTAVNTLANLSQCKGLSGLSGNVHNLSEFPNTSRPIYPSQQQQTMEGPPAAGLNQNTISNKLPSCSQLSSMSSSPDQLKIINNCTCSNSEFEGIDLVKKKASVSQATSCTPSQAQLEVLVNKPQSPLLDSLLASRQGEVNNSSFDDNSLTKYTTSTRSFKTFVTPNESDGKPWGNLHYNTNNELKNIHHKNSHENASIQKDLDTQNASVTHAILKEKDIEAEKTSEVNTKLAGHPSKFKSASGMNSWPNKSSRLCRLVCPVCHVIFFSSIDLLVHRFEQHGHICGECDSRFLTLSRLKQHKLVDHPPILVCSHCRFHTFKTEDLADHSEAVHGICLNTVDEAHSKTPLRESLNSLERQKQTSCHSYDTKANQQNLEEDCSQNVPEISSAIEQEDICPSKSDNVHPLCCPLDESKVESSAIHQVEICPSENEHVHPLCSSLVESKVTDDTLHKIVKDFEAHLEISHRPTDGTQEVQSNCEPDSQRRTAMSENKHNSEKSDRLSESSCSGYVFPAFVRETPEIPQCDRDTVSAMYAQVSQHCGLDAADFLNMSDNHFSESEEPPLVIDTDSGCSDKKKPLDDSAALNMHTRSAMPCKRKLSPCKVSTQTSKSVNKRDLSCSDSLNQHKGSLKYKAFFHSLEEDQSLTSGTTERERLVLNISVKRRISTPVCGSSKRAKNRRSQRANSSYDVSEVQKDNSKQKRVREGFCISKNSHNKYYKCPVDLPQICMNQASSKTDNISSYVSSCREDSLQIKEPIDDSCLKPKEKVSLNQVNPNKIMSTQFEQSNNFRETFKQGGDSDCFGGFKKPNLLEKVLPLRERHVMSSLPPKKRKLKKCLRTNRDETYNPQFLKSSSVKPFCQISDDPDAKSVKSLENEVFRTKVKTKLTCEINERMENCKLTHLLQESQTSHYRKSNSSRSHENLLTPFSQGICTISQGNNTLPQDNSTSHHQESNISLSQESKIVHSPSRLDSSSLADLTSSNLQLEQEQRQKLMLENSQSGGPIASCKVTAGRRWQPKDDKSKAHALICLVSGCDMKFANKRELRQHVTVDHLGKTRKYTCSWPDCSKGFFARTHLSIHMLTHTGEKPVGCHICDYRCRQRTALIWHLRKHGVFHKTAKVKTRRSFNSS